MRHIGKEIFCPISINVYIFIAIALDESIFLDVLHFPMKNIESCDLDAVPMGGATSKQASDVVCLLDGVTSVVYRHDVERENETFWLFQNNYVKSDLMSNNLKMSDDMAYKNLILD